MMNRYKRGGAGILVVVAMAVLPACVQDAIGEPEPTEGEAVDTATLAVRPPGDCGAARHRALQDEVNYQCKTVPFSCKKNMSKAELRARKDQAIACYEARVRINQVCFRGGDAGHRHAADNAMRAAAKCTRYLR